MTNNEVFKTILHLTGIGLDKNLVQHIFNLGGIDASPSKIKAWRTDIDNFRASNMPDEVLRGFFKGLFQYRDMQTKVDIQIFNMVKDQRITDNNY